MARNKRALPRVASPSIDPARPQQLQPCGTCRFVAVQGGEYACHKVPPEVFERAEGWVSVYPPVGFEKPGCGEHQEL